MGSTGNKTGLVPDYQTGPMAGYAGVVGTQYYPASGGATSLASLIDAGSRNRDAAGLWHFTVKTAASTREGADASAVVDIGEHAIGVSGASGPPWDTDGDGLPNYLEDRNGNGLFDSASETDWQTNNNGTGAANSLIVFTPLD